MGRTDKVNLKEDESLAEEVRKYSCLFDKSSPHYKDKRKSANAWKKSGPKSSQYTTVVIATVLPYIYKRKTIISIINCEKNYTEKPLVVMKM